MSLNKNEFDVFFSKSLVFSSCAFQLMNLALFFKSFLGGDFDFVKDPPVFRIFRAT